MQNSPKTLQKALEVSKSAHNGQTRASGQPYIEHPIAVQELLQETLHADTETLAAALLHDVLEDTSITGLELQRQFGPTVRRLVEGVTKIGKIERDLPSHERNMQSIRKMLRAMGKDLRVIFIKLADRLHNMRTISHLPPEKQKRIARETLDIYCPLANLLSLRIWYRELADLSFEILQPQAYAELSKHKNEIEKKYVKKLHEWVKVIQHDIQTTQRDSFTVEVRSRHLHVVHTSTMSHKALLEGIESFYRIFVLTETEEDCYKALGRIHKLMYAVPNAIHDYIAQPKLNGYQGLQTMIMSPWGHPMQVIIQSKAMDQYAKYGAALPYQEPHSTKDPWKSLPEWIEMLMAIEQREGNIQQFFHTLQSDIFGARSRVHCIEKTKRKYVDVPVHSSVLDVLYTAERKKAKHIQHGIINGQKTSLKHIIDDGDVLDIETQSKSIVRGPLDIMYLHTSYAQNALIEDLSSLSGAQKNIHAIKALSQVIDIVMDPFFPMAWRKSVQKNVLRKGKLLTDVGTAKMNPFTYISEIAQPSDFFFLNPHCFHFSSQIAPHDNVRFVLRTTVDELRNNNIIGLQVRPDVLEIHSLEQVQKKKLDVSKELVSLTVDEKEVRHPFIASLQWTFAQDSNPLKIIADLQNRIDTPLELIEFSNHTVKLNFYLDGFHAIRSAYELLYQEEQVESILRTSSI